MLLHAYDYTTLLLMWHKHGIRSYSVRIVPDSFIGDVLPTGHRTHLATSSIFITHLSFYNSLSLIFLYPSLYIHIYISLVISIYLFLYLFISIFIFLYLSILYLLIFLFLYIHTILNLYIFIHQYIHIDFSPIIYKYIKEEKKEPTLTGKKQGKPGEFRNSPFFDIKLCLDILPCKELTICQSTFILLVLLYCFVC